MQACYTSTNQPDALKSTCSNTIPLAVSMATASTRLTADPTSAVAGAKVNFTAKVTSASGTPIGSVSFTTDDGADSVTVKLVNGVAAWPTTDLHPGSRTVTATYVSDGGTFLSGPSQSATVKILAATTTSARATPAVAHQGTVGHRDG